MSMGSLSIQCIHDVVSWFLHVRLSSVAHISVQCICSTRAKSSFACLASFDRRLFSALLSVLCLELRIVRILCASLLSGEYVELSSSAVAGAVGSIESGGRSFADGCSFSGNGEAGGTLRLRLCACTASMLSNFGTGGREGVTLGEEDTSVEVLEKYDGA